MAGSEKEAGVPATSKKKARVRATSRNRSPDLSRQGVCRIATVIRAAVTLHDLPENLVFEILCHLPVRDLVRTSVLSRVWRHRWKSVPDLNIYGLDHYRVIYVLEHHSGSIRRFNAHDYDRYTRRREVKRLLTTLSRRSSSTLTNLTLEIMDKKIYIDIDHVARCLPNLTSFSAYGSVEISPQFRGFCSLRDLHIYGCISGSVSQLISSCPLLQTVYLRQGVYNDSVHFLNIVAPCLRRLSILGLQLYEFPNITAPVLERASICCDFCYSKKYCNFLTAFRNVASIKKLTLGKQFLEFLGRRDVPERLPVSLGSLSFISLLAYFGDIKQILVTLCLLRSCPNLEVLEIQMKYACYHFDISEPSDGFWKAQEHGDQFNNLETISISNIRCKKVEMDFIKFLLATVKSLKIFKIKFGSSIENKDAFMTELMYFPKISNQAQIICYQV